MDDKSKDPNRRFVLKNLNIPKISGFVNFWRTGGMEEPQFLREPAFT
jgi:hypothetical protein